MRALPPADALALAVRLLEERGFAVLARNTRGDSVYLEPCPTRSGLDGFPGRDPVARAAGGAGQLRVSNHARTPKQRRGRYAVLTSLVIREPKSAAQVEALVAAALRTYALARAARTGRNAEAAPD